MPGSILQRAFKRLHIWQRMALIGAVFLLPLSLTSYLLVKETDYKIDFARWEMFGDEYLRPLSRLLDRVWLHKTLVRRTLAGEPGLKPELARIETEVDLGFAELGQVDQKLGAALLTSPAELHARGRDSALPATLAKSWDAVRRSSSDAAASDEAHARLILDLRALITHVGDSSKLILDPDLDTYYLMDALLLKQPEILERVGRMADLAADVLARQALTSEERETLIAEAALLSAALDGSKADLETAFAEAPNFSKYAALKPALLPPLGAALDAVGGLRTRIMETVVRPAAPTLAPGELNQAVATARTTSAELWRLLLDHEDKLIGIRLDKSLTSRRNALGGLGLVVLVILLLTAGVVRNFTVLGNTVKTLRQSVQMLTQAVGNIEEQTTAHSHAITRQAAALQETQSTAQEIKQTSQIAAESAVGILQVVERADALGKSGEGAIEASLQGLGDIRQQFDEIAIKIRELDDRTVQIGGITQTVKDLADQSNMLALNAAIEAVRSGEHGKGFTVVAREIRSLADQSVQATSRVQELLENISSAVRKAVSITDSGGQRIEAGLLQVKGTGESLRELSKMVQESSQGVRQIAAAVSQQNVGISQIFTAVIDQNKMMDDTVKRLDLTRDATGIVKTASEDLAKASRDLNV